MRKRCVCDLALVVKQAAIVGDDREVLVGEVDGRLEVLRATPRFNMLGAVTAHIYIPAGLCVKKQDFSKV